MRRVIQTALFGLAALVLSGRVQATTVSVNTANWTGSCDTTGGLDGNGKWGSNGCQISWDITYNSKTCDYTYDWTVCGLKGSYINPGDINHFIIGCQSTFTASDICSGTTSGASCGNWNDQNGKNPGLPCSFNGIDFNNGGGKCTYQLVTNCAPIWGDCYATDAHTNCVCNDGFCNDGGNGCNNGGSNCNGWIPCPGTPCSVPVPSSLWMGLATLAGLATVGLMRRRRYLAA